MEKSPAPSAETGRRRWRDALLPPPGPQRTWLCVALLAALVAIFYAEENWRGRRAWENCRRELEARGEVLDWNAHVPPPIPADQNLFQAPRMAEWFVREQSATLGPLLNPGALATFVQQRRSNVVAEITFVASNDPPVLAQASLLLRYQGRALTLARPEDFTAPPPNIIPLIQFEEVPLTVAITNLARQEQLNFVYDPRVLAAWSDPGGRSSEPNVSFRWENLSARQVLFALLEAHELAWVEDSRTGIARVVSRRGTGRSVVVQEDARRRLREVMTGAFGPGTTNRSGALLTDVRGHNFVAGEPPAATRIRLVVLASDVPGTREVKDFLPTDLAALLPGGARGWRVAASGTNQFEVYLEEEPAYSAKDFLAWSEQWEPVFALMRDALKRPLARIDSDYQRPFEAPMPNYVNLRTVAQILAERAQCHLLLGQPDQALEDLTLLHDLRRFLSARPTLLVTAMIDVAIAGLYGQVVADGLRLRAWREPELSALQRQLAGIDLLSPLATALRTEPLATCRTFESYSAEEVDEVFHANSANRTAWQRLRDPQYVLLKFAPRGWVLQNFARIANLEFNLAAATFDVSNRLVHPAGCARFNRELDALSVSPNPYTMLAREAVPRFSRAVQTAARNQTQVNLAFIACGLERYRLAQANHPDALAALEEQHGAKLPHDVIGGAPLKYRRADDGKFLLYSVGWNETDEGGRFSRGKDGQPDYDGPDWVWH